MFRAIIFPPTPNDIKWITNYFFERIPLDFCFGIFHEEPFYLLDSKIKFVNGYKIGMGRYEDYTNWYEIPPIDEDIIKSIPLEEFLSFEMMAFRWHRKLPDQPIFEPNDVISHFRDLYSKHLRYWNWVLDFHKINLVIDITIPHSGYDNFIYSLCKVKNIRFLCGLSWI